MGTRSCTNPGNRKEYKRVNVILADKMPKLIRTGAPAIVAVCLVGAVLLAQGNTDANRQAAEQVVPSIYSSARTELAKLLIYGLFRKIRVLAQDGVLAFFGDATREDGRVDIDDLVADLVLCQNSTLWIAI